MMFYILLACLGIVMGEEEPTIESCNHLYPDELMPFVIPDAEMLPSVCPKTVDYLECEENKIIQENSEVDEVLLGIKDVVRGICENNSKLQKDYLESVECFRHYHNNVPPCYEAAQRIYVDYRHFITGFDIEDRTEQYNDEADSDDSITYNEPYCLMSAYAVGCVGTKILDTCGEKAQDTFIEIIQRSKILTQTCPKAEAEKLRSEFLDFLAFEKEHSHIEIFREVFNFKRK